MALVYIAEDDTDIRELETYALKSAGLSVESFPDLIRTITGANK